MIPERLQFQGQPEQCPQCGAFIVDSRPGPQPLSEVLLLSCGARWVYSSRTDLSYQTEKCQDAVDTGLCPG